MLMQPSNTPPAPPPYQPVTSGYDPYDFINNPTSPRKKRLLPGGNSNRSRLIIAAVFTLVLILLALVAAIVISSGGSGIKTDYTSLLQQQTEIIRISDIGVSKATQAEAKNIAITTQLSLTSQQPKTRELAKKAGLKIDAKTLALGKDTKTDALLTTAEQTNQFDSVLIKTLQSELKKYQTTLKKIHDASSSKSTKETLSKYYNEVSLLIGKQ